MSAEQVASPVPAPIVKEEPTVAPKPTSSTASSVKSFLAGGFGGMASVLVG